MKTIDTFNAHIKIGENLFHLTWKKRGEFKIGHRFYEKNGEFGGPRSESLCFKKGTPTMLGPNLKGNVKTLHIGFHKLSYHFSNHNYFNSKKFINTLKTLHNDASFYAIKKDIGLLPNILIFS